MGMGMGMGMGISIGVMGAGLSRQIPLEEILAATDSWDPRRKLGEGGFGCVYRGDAANGEVWAVKRANTVSDEQLEEFEKEVSFMSRMDHQHLMRLIGFRATPCYSFPLLVFPLHSFVPCSYLPPPPLPGVIHESHGPPAPRATHRLLCHSLPPLDTLFMCGPPPP
ncbi:unnamed protein product, partial [Closterium sp. NIES-54]